MNIETYYESKREEKILSLIRKAEEILERKIIVAPYFDSILHRVSAKSFYSTLNVNGQLHMPAISGCGINVRINTTTKIAVKTANGYKRHFSLSPVLMEKSVANMRESEKLTAIFDEENAKTGMVAEIHSFGLILINDDGYLREVFSLKQVVKGVAEDVLEEYLSSSTCKKQAKTILEMGEIKAKRLEKLKALTAKKGEPLTKEEINAVKRYETACVIGKLYIDKLKKIDAFEVAQTDEMDVPLILSNAGGALRRATKKDNYELFKVKFFNIAENKAIKKAIQGAVNKEIREKI